MPVDCSSILGRYFDGAGFNLITVHGRLVADLALHICDCTTPVPSAEERRFIEEAALLHDIGICRVNAPDIGMHGEHPYLMHGVIGRGILEEEGLPKHALVCERHIGVGLTVTDIDMGGLPLPRRDMTPQSRAEEIICFADLFYSKSLGKLELRKHPDKVRRKLAAFGPDKLQIFDIWMKQFGCALLAAPVPE